MSLVMLYFALGIIWAINASHKQIKYFGVFRSRLEATCYHTSKFSFVANRDIISLYQQE